MSYTRLNMFMKNIYQDVYQDVYQNYSSSVKSINLGGGGP